MPRFSGLFWISSGFSVGKFGLSLTLMSKVFRNEKGITNGNDGRTNSVNVEEYGIVEEVA